MQESTLENLNYGDRAPSACSSGGPPRAAQPRGVADPVYAAVGFLHALAGYQAADSGSAAQPLWEAAQGIQGTRSSRLAPWESQRRNRRPGHPPPPIAPRTRVPGPGDRAGHAAPPPGPPPRRSPVPEPATARPAPPGRSGTRQAGSAPVASRAGPGARVPHRPRARPAPRHPQAGHGPGPTAGAGRDRRVPSASPAGPDAPRQPAHSVSMRHIVLAGMRYNRESHGGFSQSRAGSERPRHTDHPRFP